MTVILEWRFQAESLVEGQALGRITGIQREGSADGSQGLTDPARPLSY
jgi:hypothetical protein